MCPEVLYMLAQLSNPEDAEAYFSDVLNSSTRPLSTPPEPEDEALAATDEDGYLPDRKFSPSNDHSSHAHIRHHQCTRHTLFVTMCRRQARLGCGG
jgi:hypothetical protein